MTMLRIQLPCPVCKDHDDSQPNHCRRCGGSTRLQSIIPIRQLSYLADIPEVLGASVVIPPRRRRRRKGGAR